MQVDANSLEMQPVANKTNEVTYHSEKDFYKGVSGELRLKAEGLFKKAREKGISIEEITFTTLKENTVDIPGLGVLELPTIIAKVRGRHIESGQIIVDAKQIDYYNRYLKYVSEKLEKKNLVYDERGKPVYQFGSKKVKEVQDFALSDWERFEIGKALVNDKEFGLEKTITGACDRVIRKLMGENDWLYPEEAALLEEEFNQVQAAKLEQQEQKRMTAPLVRKATERQIHFLKSKIKNAGISPEDEEVMGEILRQFGYDRQNVSDLSTGEMSRIIDNIGTVLPKVKDILSKKRIPPAADYDDQNRRLTQ